MQSVSFFIFVIINLVVKGIMKKMKSLADLLARADDSTELYTSDQKQREQRKNKGHYTKSGSTFDFIFLIKSWDDVVGSLLAKNSIPLKIKYNNLYICTKHAVFAQEMQFLSQDIIKKVEDNFPSLEGKIKELKFLNNEKVFNFKEIKKEENFKLQKPKKSLHPFSPEFKMRKFKAQELFEDIEDEEIKKALIDFYLS